MLNEMANKTISLITFILEFEKLVTRWKNKEAEKDYIYYKEACTLFIKHSSILKHVAQVYTYKIYKIFENEYLDGCVTSNFKNIPCCGSLYRFEVMIQSQRRRSKV